MENNALPVSGYKYEDLYINKMEVKIEQVSIFFYGKQRARISTK
jgi:hypothetical protein